jgi:hypothetical protein
VSVDKGRMHDQRPTRIGAWRTVDQSPSNEREEAGAFTVWLDQPSVLT